MMTLVLVTVASTAKFLAYALLFFFQAEDGIRDLTVTGVQTCALPISRPAFVPARRSPAPRRCPGRVQRRSGRESRAASPSAARESSSHRWAAPRVRVKIGRAHV